MERSGRSNMSLSVNGWPDQKVQKSLVRSYIKTTFVTEMGIWWLIQLLIWLYFEPSKTKLVFISQTYSRCRNPRPHCPLHSPQLLHSFQIDTEQKFSNPLRLEIFNFSGLRTEPFQCFLLMNVPKIVKIEHKGVKMAVQGHLVNFMSRWDNKIARRVTSDLILCHKKAMKSLLNFYVPLKILCSIWAIVDRVFFGHLSTEIGYCKNASLDVEGQDTVGEFSGCFQIAFIHVMIV